MVDDSEIERDYEGSAAFNAGLVSTNVLIACRMEIRDAANTRDVSTWIIKENNYYREIRGLVKIKPQEEEQIKEHREKYYAILQDHNQRCVGPEKTEDVCTHLDQAVGHLDAYDCILQDVAREHELLMPKSTNPAVEFGRGRR